MSDIDFQNGFIVGIATRGLTVSKSDAVIDIDSIRSRGWYVVGSVIPSVMIYAYRVPEIIPVEATT